MEELNSEQHRKNCQPQPLYRISLSKGDTISLPEGAQAGEQEG